MLCTSSVKKTLAIFLLDACILLFYIFGVQLARHSWGRTCLVQENISFLFFVCLEYLKLQHQGYGARISTATYSQSYIVSE